MLPISWTVFKCHIQHIFNPKLYFIFYSEEKKLEEKKKLINIQANFQVEKRNAQLLRTKWIKRVECWHLIKVRNAANYYFCWERKKYENTRNGKHTFKTCTFTHISVQSRDRVELNNDRVDKWGEIVYYFAVEICNAMKQESESEKNTNPGQQQQVRMHRVHFVFFWVKCLHL